MEIKQFWKIVETAKEDSPDDSEAQVELIQRHLTTLSEEEIIDFDRILTDLRFRAYQNDLWAAAYLLNGGCSDDCFEYFRGWLIAQGEHVYENALRDPETLADLDLPEDEDAECESLLSVAAMAYEEKMGKDLPNVSRRYPELTGAPWREDELETKYPRLSSKMWDLSEDEEEDDED